MCKNPRLLTFVSGYSYKNYPSQNEEACLPLKSCSKLASIKQQQEDQVPPDYEAKPVLSLQGQVHREDHVLLHLYHDTTVIQAPVQV